MGPEPILFLTTDQDCRALPPHPGPLPQGEGGSGSAVDYFSSRPPPNAVRIRL